MTVLNGRKEVGAYTQYDAPHGSIKFSGKKALQDYMQSERGFDEDLARVTGDKLYNFLRADVEDPMLVSFVPMWFSNDQGGDPDPRYWAYVFQVSDRKYKYPGSPDGAFVYYASDNVFTPYVPGDNAQYPLYALPHDPWVARVYHEFNFDFDAFLYNTESHGE